MPIKLGIQAPPTPWDLGRELKREIAFLNKLEQKGSAPLSATEVEHVHSLKGRVQVVSKEYLTAKEKIQLKTIQQQLMAYEHRYDILKPEQDLDKIANLTGKLVGICQRYKKNPKLYPGGDGELTKYDRKQLRLLAEKYPHFAEQLIKNNQKGGSSDHLTTEFVKWALRERCSIDVFVQFPHERMLLSACFLSKRTGAVHQSEGIKVIQEEGRKVVALKMQTGEGGTSAWVNILDKGVKVKLPNLVDPTAPLYELTIKEMFDQFGKKTRGYENVEYVDDGVVNWHAGKLGSYDPTVGKYDVLRPKDDASWLTKIPTLARMDREELREHYPGQTLCENGQYAFGIRATRIRPNYDISECHGYIELIIPDGEDSFLIKPFGLQTKVLPQNDGERVYHIASTQIGAIHTPDESFYLSQRQSIGEIFPVSSREFNLLRDYIGHNIEKANDGNKIFQAIGNNCANFAQRCHRVVLGSHLIEHIEELVTQKLGNSPFILRKLKDGLFAFDDEDLEDLLEDMIPTLSYAELALVIEKCHGSLARTLLKDQLDLLPPIDSFNALNIDSSDRPSDEIQEAVIKLVLLSLKSQQFYRMHALDADYHGPLNYIVIPLRMIDTLIKWAIELIQCIIFIKSIGRFVTKPLQWLRNLQLALLSLLLLSFRWKQVASKTGEVRYKSVLTNKYHWRKTFNLPCAMWKREEEKPALQKKVSAVAHKLLASMTKAIPRSQHSIAI